MKKFFKILAVCCFILPFAILLSACGKEAEAIGIEVYLNGTLLNSSGASLNIPNGSSPNIAEKIKVKVIFDDETEQELSLKTEDADGYELISTLPESLTPGATYYYEIQYKDFTPIRINVSIEKSTDTVRITSSTLNKTYDGLPVADPLYTVTSRLPVTFEWYAYTTGEAQKLPSAPSEVGEYYVIASTEGSVEYKPAQSAKKDFTISKATPQTPQVQPLNGTYDPDKVLNDYYIGEGFTWNTPNVKPTCNTTTYKASYNPNPKNYNSIEINVTLNLAKATPNVSTQIQLGDLFSDDLPTTSMELLNTILTLAKNKTTAEGAFAWNDSATYSTDISSFGAKTYHATFTPADTDNYTIINDIKINFCFYHVIPIPTFAFLTDNTLRCVLPYDMDYSTFLNGFDSSIMETPVNENKNINITTITAEGEYYIYIKLKDAASKFICWSNHEINYPAITLSFRVEQTT